MSNAEWEAWRSKWTSAEGPLPDIRARALRQASRHRLTSLIFFALLVSGMLSNLLFQDDPLTRWFLILWAIAISIYFVKIYRGIGLGNSGHPREALAFLEKRVRVERQGAWIFGLACAAVMLFVSIRFTELFGPEWTVKLVARCIMLALAALLFWALWWVRRLADRQQAELDLWRRWLDEQQL